ncbi:hypothetical protein L1987_40340 [Smallanthus sonchifolius]|uniref:Uncharacterized protein n=1 Tax=Smallanthus sonchifolius TaxID=185202 RepID=A0ACB9GSU9_9ASTR|nr:hypothetical protein L1987_40340 [Smallanthus sonchifolius]
MNDNWFNPESDNEHVDDDSVDEIPPHQEQEQEHEQVQDAPFVADLPEGNTLMYGDAWGKHMARQFEKIVRFCVKHGIHARSVLPSKWK